MKFTFGRHNGLVFSDPNRNVAVSLRRRSFLKKFVAGISLIPLASSNVVKGDEPNPAADVVVKPGDKVDVVVSFLDNRVELKLNDKQFAQINQPDSQSPILDPPERIAMEEKLHTGMNALEVALLRNTDKTGERAITYEIQVNSRAQSMTKIQEANKTIANPPYTFTHNIQLMGS